MSEGILLPGNPQVDSSGSGGITLETNGVENGSQVLLNLEAGTGVTLTDNGTGSVLIDASGLSNLIPDDVFVQYGTTAPFYTGSQVTGFASPNMVIAGEVGHPTVFTSSDNKTYDFVGVDVSGFVNFPMWLFTGKDQVHNRAAAFFMNEAKFQINAIDGDGFADWLPADADGVSIELVAGSGGSLGGNPGHIYSQGGPASFGNIVGGNVILQGGPSHGTGDTSVIKIGDDGNNFGATLEFNGQSVIPHVSATGQARLLFSTVNNRMILSENAGDFVNLGNVSSSVAADTEIAYFVGPNDISGNMNLTYDRNNVRFGIGLNGVATGTIVVVGKAPSTSGADGDVISLTTSAGADGTGIIAGGDGGNFTINLGAGGGDGGAGGGMPGTFIVNGEADILNALKAFGQLFAFKTLYESQGTGLSAANDITLSEDGNYYQISGSTQINRIAIGNFTPGTRFILQFAGTPLVKHNQTSGSGFIGILLENSTDYTATVGSSLQCFLNGTGKFECSPFRTP